MLRQALLKSASTFTKSQQLRCLSSTATRFKNVSEEDWSKAYIDTSKVANNAVPQTPPTNPNVVPNSMLAAFNNMFDRGPNVGVEIITKTGGFVLSNNVKIEQPLILLNGSAFLWNPPPRTPGHMPMKDWDLDAFKIFDIVSPRPELVLFGTGKELAPLPEEIRKYFFKKGMQVDQMNTVSKAKRKYVLCLLTYGLFDFIRNMLQLLIMYLRKKDEGWH